MPSKRAVIFANGDLENPRALQMILLPGDYLVAVDGGLNHLDQLHLKPLLLIGDLDSVDPTRLEELRKEPVEILRYPVDKNETDLELAIQAMIGRGFRSILIVASTGGRLDQTLGNLALLAGIPESVEAKFESGNEEIFLCRSKSTIRGNPGDTVSLLPWGKRVKGVSTKGLKFKLERETLYPEKTRGISNVMTGKNATVQIESGLLLGIHTRKMKGEI